MLNVRNRVNYSMFIRLGEFEKRLEGIYLIMGVGLTSNVYVIGRRGVTLIDLGNGARANSLVNQFKKMNLAIGGVVKVVLTHSHFDHVGGLEELSQKAFPKILVHEAEAHMLKGLISEQRIVKLRGGEEVETERGSLEVVHTPGHSRGAICLYDRNNKTLFSGDTVFPNGFFGRCDLEGGDARAMVASLKRLTTLDVEILLPGHEKPVFQNAREHIRLSYDTARNYFLPPSSS